MIVLTLWLDTYFVMRSVGLARMGVYKGKLIFGITFLDLGDIRNVLIGCRVQVGLEALSSL